MDNIVDIKDSIGKRTMQNMNKLLVSLATEVK